MQTPYIGNIILFGGNFPPIGWATCDGSLLPIQQYDALYNLIGTTYGGDGQTNFALPDLRSRIPIHVGQGNGLSPYVIGQAAGVESVSITAQTMPQHSHPVASNSGVAGSADPTSNFLGAQTLLQEYIPGAQANAVMNGSAIAPSPGGQAHGNIMPSLGMNFIIALEGIYPSQQ